MSYQAFHDPLTGLSNRRRFVEHADAALRARPRPGSVAALFLDLDDFKTINDSRGHAAGDELLTAVAGRLQHELRDGDLAARLGGDEFGVLLTDIPDGAYAATVADRLLAALATAFDVAGQPATIGASIGIALYDPAMTSVDDLLGEADVAMYQAKALGKGRHQRFSGMPAVDRAAANPNAAAAAAEPRPTGERSWLPRPTVRRPGPPRAAIRPEG